MSVGQSETQKNSTQIKQDVQEIKSDVKEIQRRELVTLLERTTAEVKASRKLLEAYELRKARLEAQIAEYKESNRILDEAYTAAVSELAELRAAIKSLREAIKIKDELIAKLKERVGKLEKTVSRQRNTIVILGAVIVGLGALLLHK